MMFGMVLCCSKNVVGGLSLVILFCRMNAASLFSIAQSGVRNACITVEKLDGREVLATG